MLAVVLDGDRVKAAFGRVRLDVGVADLRARLGLLRRGRRRFRRATRPKSLQAAEPWNCHGRPSRPVVRQVADDRTFFVRAAAQRALTLRQITSQRVPKFLKLLQSSIDIRQFLGQKPLH